MKKLRVTGPVGWAVMAVMVGGGVVRARTVILPGKAVGPVRLGMSAEELVRAAGRGETVTAELSPMPSPDADVWQYPDHGFEVLLGHASPAARVRTVRCVLAGGPDARVQRFRGRTKEGIGMGSTLADLTAAWGEPERLRAFPAAGGPEPILEAAYPSRGITLMLKDGRVNWLAVRSAEKSA